MKHIQLILLFFPIFLFGQTDTWKNYTTSTVIKGIAYDGTDILMATDGGVAQYNTVTGSTNYLNRVNANLPNNRITSIAVDQAGTRWLGTPDGLVKWEGDDFTYINPGQQPAEIWHLGVDKLGTIWMHLSDLETKLASYHPTTGWKTYNIDSLVGQGETLRDIRTNSLLTGVYFMTYKNDVGRFYHFDGDLLTSTNVPTEAGTPWNTVTVSNWDIDSKGHFWFLDYDRLYRKTTENWEFESLPAWLGDFIIDNNDVVWLGERYFGKLFRRDSSGQYTQITMNPNDLNSGYQFSLSPTNELWILHKYTLFKKVDQDLIPIRSSAFDMPTNSVVKLVVSGQQKIWSAFLSSYSFFHLKTPIGVFENQTWHFDYYHSYSTSPTDMVKDVNERVLVANASNLSVFDGSWKRINAVNYPDDPILSVACRPGTDQVWVGGEDFIGKIENETYQPITLPQGCKAEIMTVDNNGWVWVSHFDSATGDFGLAYYAETTWHFVPFSDLAFDTDSDIFSDLEISPDGKLFLVGIKDVVYFDGVSWTNTHLPNSYGSFRTIAFDGPDHFWVGTNSFSWAFPSSEFGLIESDHGVVNVYKYKDYALPHSNINALAVDGYHNVWMGSIDGGGIAVFNKAGVVVATKNTPALAPPLTAVAYPNPTSGDNITIEFDVFERSDVHLRVFNQLGQQVAGQTLQNADPNHFQWTLEKSTIGTGYFFWSITTNSGEKTGKIVFVD